jgi:hypothetical protein
VQLNGIAQKLKFKGLQTRAREFLEAIAAERGLSREQLEDRVVPDLDLDERGGRVFDFGPRQFQLVLDSDCRPLVRDGAGKLKEDLPRPGANDDQDRAAAAVQEWKVLKKQLREVVRVQAERLQQALVIGRRWNLQEFETFLVSHPLMTHLVRRLLWNGHDEKGTRVLSFRVTEEQKYADMQDRPCSLKGLKGVGLVHPLHLTEAERKAWGQVLGKYEIIPPFPQLDRPVHTLEPGEQGAAVLTRFNQPLIPAADLVFTLEGRGWTRGNVGDNGYVDYHYKAFPGAEVTGVVEYGDGVPTGRIQDGGDQQIERVYFLPGLVTSARPFSAREMLPLGRVNPLVLSEVLADLTLVSSRGR